ncbi:MAG: hypothetical protein DRP09_05755 [Candidatus Thorarchaeota archaeon]|nr:MAG: hypothetical protein DRP09_05755 [Candidatus Thorarchaeota archaeon]
MHQRVENSPEWVTIGLRVLIILLFPISLYVQVTNTGVWTSLTCLLTPMGFIYYWQTQLLTAIGPLFLIMMSAVLPCAFFSYWIGRMPLRRSIGREALVMILLVFGATTILIPIGALDFLPVVSYWPTELAPAMPIVATAVLVILPLILRETVRASLPEGDQSLTLRAAEQIVGTNQLRNKTITVALWAALFLLPSLCQMGVTDVDDLQFQFTSLVYTYDLLVYSEGSGLIVLASVTMLQSYGFLVLTNSVRILFVREVLRWHSSGVSRGRLLRLGIFGDLLPFGFASVSSVGSSLLARTLFPLPLLSIVGLVSAKAYKYDTESNQIWDDVPATTGWMEGAEDSAETEISVPITLLLWSRLKHMVRRKKSPSKK